MAKKREYFSIRDDKTAEEAIALTGKDESGWQSLGISSQLFYRWCGQYDSFRLAVDRGRGLFRATDPEILKLKLLSHIAQSLTKLDEPILEHTWERTTITRKNGADKTIFVDHKESEIITQKERSLPPWMSKIILPNGLSSNDSKKEEIKEISQSSLAEIKKHLLFSSGEN